MLLCDLAERSTRRRAGIGEHDIELALLPLDLCEQAIQVVKARRVCLYGGHISANLLRRRRQLRLTAPRDEEVGAFAHELLGRRQANATTTTGNECNLSFELAHVCSPSLK